MEFDRKSSETVDAVLAELRKNETVRQMRRYRQHGNVTTFDHCENVARLSCYLNQRFRLGADEGALLRGAMLHDFFLYDWHAKDGTHRWHGYRHPARAAENAVRYLGVGEKEQQIIRSHMWPLTLRSLPRCREAWIVCLADKYCCLAETFGRS